MKITGTFEVALKPTDSYVESTQSLTVGRMTLDKTFSGALNATSKGEMLSIRTATEGSAGYVAIEIVQGELEGKRGQFALQHYGQMSKGEQHLVLQVIPDSGTDELSGLSGDMSIKMEGGQHHYVFEYQL